MTKLTNVAMFNSFQKGRPSGSELAAVMSAVANGSVEFGHMHPLIDQGMRAKQGDKRERRSDILYI
jgi:hypothetical protein